MKSHPPRIDRLCRRAQAGSPARRACCASSRGLARRRLRHQKRLCPNSPSPMLMACMLAPNRAQALPHVRFVALFSRQMGGTAESGVARRVFLFGMAGRTSSTAWISAGFAISRRSWRPEASAGPLDDASMSPNRRSARPSSRSSGFRDAVAATVDPWRRHHGGRPASLRALPRFFSSNSNAPNSTSESRWSGRRATSRWACLTAS